MNSQRVMKVMLELHLSKSLSAQKSETTSTCTVTSCGYQLSEPRKNIEILSSIRFARQCTVFVCVFAVYLELSFLIYLILTSDFNSGFAFLLICTLCIHNILNSISGKFEMVRNCNYLFKH